MMQMSTDVKKDPEMHAIICAAMGAEPLGLDCKRFIDSKIHLRTSATSAVNINSKGFLR